MYKKHKHPSWAIQNSGHEHTAHSASRCFLQSLICILKIQCDRIRFADSYIRHSEEFMRDSGAPTCTERRRGARGVPTRRRLQLRQCQFRHRHRRFSAARARRARVPHIANNRFPVRILPRLERKSSRLIGPSFVGFSLFNIGVVRGLDANRITTLKF